MNTRIEHVSDTALLVAASRAGESERPDGLIRDPFAARLAGDRGIALLKNVAVPEWMELALGLRTRFLDELLQLALASGVDSILNLGAGLDARPWRLSLPADLRWTEVDFPEMLDYKYGVLEDTAPLCRLERKSADLSDASEREAVIADAVSGARQPLLLSEGLLMYLPAKTVSALATEAREAGFRFWLMDTSSPGLMRLRMETQWRTSIAFAPRLTWRVRRSVRWLNNTAGGLRNGGCLSRRVRSSRSIAS